MELLPFLLLLLFLLFPFLTLTESNNNLTLDYYKKTCPKLQQIIDQIITEKQQANPTTAAGTLRIFFHDCMVQGCDASLLVATNAFNAAERDGELDQSLSGDGFDVITRIKTALELECPGIVSCSDILALAARDLVVMVGGPHYNVLLGRKDGLTSKAQDVAGNIPTPNMTMTQLINLFGSKGFSVQEMVALTGAHTIGFSHCTQFSDRIFNFSKTSQFDPALNAKYAEGLQKLCADYKKTPGLAAFNDVMTPGKFDNMYFINLQRGLGLLASDQAMAMDPRTKPFLDLYASNQDEFFKAFTRAVEKLSTYKVKTGKEGEVRDRCDNFNSISTNPK